MLINPRSPFGSILLGFSLLLMTTSQLIADDKTFATRIATVDVRYLLKNAPQSELASNALKTRFLDKEKELETELTAIKELEESLKNTSQTLGKDEKRAYEREIRSRKRDHNRSREDYREDLRIARSSALEDVQKIVFEAIDAVRINEDIDVVIQDYVSANERISITETVLEYLQAKLDSEAKKDK